MKLSSIITPLAVSAMSVMASTQAQAVQLVGLDINNNLVIFDSATPGITNTVTTGPRFIGIDYRPTNNLLYGIAFDGTNDRIYTINPSNGVATAGAVLSSPINASALSTGFDFNPVADTNMMASLRVVNTANQNFAVNVDTGAVTLQGTLNYSSTDPSFGQDPAITAAAYTNNFAGATATTLFDIDADADTLVRQIPPPSGNLTTVGPLGIDFSSEGGFDIFGASTAFAVSNDAVSGIPSLYDINLSTGQASLLGAIDNPRRITSLSAVPVPFEFSSTMGIWALGALGAIAQLKSKLQKRKSSKVVSLITNERQVESV